MKDRIPWKLFHWILPIVGVVLVLVFLIIQYIMASPLEQLVHLLGRLVDLSGLTSYLLLVAYFGLRVGQRLFNDKEFVLRDVPRSVLLKALAARAHILGGDGQAKQGRQLNDIAVSVTYLNRVKHRNDQLGTLLLFTVAAFYALVYVLDLGAIEYLLMAPALLILLLLIKEVVLEFRITNGLFGTNPYEARTMINFLLENAVEIDFTDGSGKPKRALLPEKFSEQASGVIPAQEAKA